MPEVARALHLNLETLESTSSQFLNFQFWLIKNVLLKNPNPSLYSKGEFYLLLDSIEATEPENLAVTGSFTGITVIQTRGRTGSGRGRFTFSDLEIKGINLSRKLYATEEIKICD